MTAVVALILLVAVVIGHARTRAWLATGDWVEAFAPERGLGRFRRPRRGPPPPLT